MDIMGHDLLNITEEARIEHKISGSLNSNFTALTRNTSNSTSFMEFWPPEFCNITYKMISKIIATHLKENLSYYMSQE